MKDCVCGKPVRLSATRITVNRRRGVAHAIVHMNGGSVCISGDWTCAAMKPYPKNEDERESRKLMSRWEKASAQEQGSE